MTQFDNATRRQVFSLPELIRSQYQDLEPKTRSILSFEEIFNVHIGFSQQQPKRQQRGPAWRRAGRVFVCG